MFNVVMLDRDPGDHHEHRGRRWVEEAPHARASMQAQGIRRTGKCRGAAAGDAAHPAHEDARGVS
jgi:hypothetical protein